MDPLPLCGTEKKQKANKLGGAAVKLVGFTEHFCPLCMYVHCDNNPTKDKDT